MSQDKEHGGYVGKVREETQNYLRNVLHELDSLRAICTELQAENTRLNDELRIREEQKSELAQRLDTIRTEGEQYVAQYAQLEQHHANLANLYTASYQLHGTLDRSAVLTAMQEIVVNLIGSEEFAIVERDAAGEFRAVAAIGVADADDLHRRDEHVASATQTGALWVRPPETESPLTACVPLKLDGRITGYIAICRLLPHKTELEPLDHELFDLLATHAATALYCTSLAARSENERSSA